jgi:hypothetical protein
MRVMVLLGFLFWPALVFSGSFTDAQIIDAIIKQSRQSYYATGHPCACPDDKAKNGSSCGARSAYSRPGGAAPLCYPKDVTRGMIEDFRNKTPQR